MRKVRYPVTFRLLGANLTWIRLTALILENLAVVDDGF